MGVVVEEMEGEAEEDILEEVGEEEEVDREVEVLTELVKEYKIWDWVVEEVEEVEEKEEGVEEIEEGVEVTGEGEEEEEVEERMMSRSLTASEPNQNTSSLKKELLEPQWPCQQISLGFSRSLIPGCSSTGWTSPWTRRGPS